MLVQKPYHHPYIPSSPASLPYVGGELAELTSMTPFYRGQGEPIYPHTNVIRKTNLGGLNYGNIMVGLSQGAKGKSVEDLQNALIAKGYYIGDSGADGDFGPSTATAVKQFQKDNKLGQTGTIDAKTKKLLEKEKGAGLKTVFDLAQQFIPQNEGTTPQTNITISPYQKQGLSTGAKVGIAIGAGVLLVGLIATLSNK